MASYPLIDIYCHIFPDRYFQEMDRVAPNLGNIGKRLRGITKLFDLDRASRRWTSSATTGRSSRCPIRPSRTSPNAKTGMDLARIANDAMAELCRSIRSDFRLRRGVIADRRRGLGRRGAPRRQDLGAGGMLTFTNIAGEPLDDPKFGPFFAAMAELDLPIWLHPARTAAMTDYPSETKSRFEMWWCFGWPYETSVAMARLVFSGLFDRHPRLKIVTHHLGGMIPYFDGRVGAGPGSLGSAPSDEDYSNILPSLKRPHLEYFQEFYADTAMFGGKYGMPCGLEFFGADNVVFATDTPLGPIGRPSR